MKVLLRTAVRVAAILIAVLGIVDPEITASRRSPLPVDIGVIASRLDAIPNGSSAGTRGEAARRSAAVIARAVGEGARIRVVPPVSPLPCDLLRRCVVITDGADPVAIPVDQQMPLFVVHIGGPLSPNVSIVEASAAPATYLGAEAVVRVTLRGAGVAGRRTLVRVADGTTPAGEIEHAWTADGEVTIAVPWWPMDASPRALRIDAVAVDGEVTAADNQTIVSVAAAGAPMPVLFFDPRPSWMATFVRRAAESDRRVEVLARTRLGPTIAVGAERVRLDEATLLAAQAVVIGAPEAITVAEAEVLERYVRVRGGSLVLLPDRPFDGPIARLVPGKWTERMTSDAGPVGPLRVSELLTLDSAGPHDRVLAPSADPARPAIVSFPSGRGQIIVSGAMDAWRYRTAGFNRFWQSLIVSAAVAGGAPVAITTNPPTAAPGERVEVSVRRRTFAAAAPLESSAEVACGSDQPQPIRLWPTGDADSMAGGFRAAAPGPCRIEVVVDGRRATIEAPLAHVLPAPARRSAFERLDEAARTTGGSSVQAGQEGPIIEALQAVPRSAAPVRRHPTHPMRSPWWIVPFAACLGFEWWDRRRSGLR